MRRKLLALIFAIAIGVLLYLHSTDGFQAPIMNILETPMTPCSTPPGKTTGFFRDGTCSTGYQDSGTHVVCAVVDDTFLQFTKSKGNDLITPTDSFPGLVAGDKWCLCALRWMEAYNANKAPKIIPESTNIAALRYGSKEIFLAHNS
jgi:hypothetical protein